MIRSNRVAFAGRRAIVLQGCTASLCLIAGIAQGQMLIRPVVVELAARQRAAAISVTLGDTARAPVRLQAELLRWTQDLEGRPITVASNDLIVSPPLVELQPGQRQVIRVALRAAPSNEELAYRLILEDVAEPAEGALVHRGWGWISHALRPTGAGGTVRYGAEHPALDRVPS